MLLFRVTFRKTWSSWSPVPKFKHWKPRHDWQCQEWSTTPIESAARMSETESKTHKNATATTQIKLCAIRESNFVDRRCFKFCGYVSCDVRCQNDWEHVSIFVHIHMPHQWMYHRLGRVKLRVELVCSEGNVCSFGSSNFGTTLTTPIKDLRWVHAQPGRRRAIQGNQSGIWGGYFPSRSLHLHLGNRYCLFRKLSVLSK